MNVNADSQGTVRFLLAQDAETHPTFGDAMREIRDGSKRTHWIWYVFPQLRGLGTSPHSTFYGVRDIDEAKDYLKDKKLRERLIEASVTLLDANRGKPIGYVMGLVDAMKVMSSMTLFEKAASELENEGTVGKWAGDVRKAASDVLDEFYAGERCMRTLAILSHIS